MHSFLVGGFDDFDRFNGFGGGRFDFPNRPGTLVQLTDNKS